ncbi:MAG: FAD:protein FMN transferase [Acidimicrobiia bacterium]
MTQTTFNAMGTTVELHGEAATLGTARTAFDVFERRFSRFMPDSELSALNATCESTVRLSPTMAEIMDVAQDLRDRTDGLVDVGLGRAVIDWGYARTFEEVGELDHPPPPLARPTWKTDSGVLHRAEGTTFDLGGIAKGWTCDRLVESGLATVASAGGDVRSADPTLVVDVVDADGDLAAEVFVGVGALATSSIMKRRWRVAGRAAHHIVDPRTMAPVVTPVASASVVADTAAEAEAGAKAVLIRGVDGLAWADAQPWISQAVAIWHDGNVYGTTLARAS